MITNKLKEQAILCCAFATISQDVEAEKKTLGITNRDILNTDDHIDLRKIVRLLQKLEIKIGNNTSKAEKYLNKSIERVNAKMGVVHHIKSMVGYALLTLYKDEWKNKSKQYQGLVIGDINEVYNIVEKSLTKEDRKQYINSSFDLAEALFKEIKK